MSNYELAKSTPMMRQWYEIKKSLTDEIVFCRVGDFYELFFDDAEIASKELDIQLTKRKLGNGTYPLAGVPVRSLDAYINRLVSLGYKVAIIDQLEDAKAVKGKKTISRGLTKIISRGTVTDEAMLVPGKNNYLAAFATIKKGKKSYLGMATCDVSTGDFRAATFTEANVNDLIRAYTKYAPVEILYSQDIDDISKTIGIAFDNNELLTAKPMIWFESGYAKQVVYNQFNVKTVKGFGLEEDSAGTCAAGALLKYLQETQFTEFPHILSIRSFDVHNTMVLDTTAIRGLELFQNTQDQSSYATLFSLLDETITPMGSRLLRHWIANPLANKQQIEKRLEAVEIFFNDNLLQYGIRSILENIGDIERLSTRISMKTARPDELIKLALSLEAIPPLKAKLQPYKDKFPDHLMGNIDPCQDITTIIRKTIIDDPSSNVGLGKVISEGYNQELDKYRGILKEGKSWLDKFIAREKQKYGLTTLRVKQNNVFGYFIEISKKEVDKVPEEYVKKQVMINTSRYITEELKTWETDVISAEIKIQEIETLIYNNLLQNLINFITPLQSTARGIAVIDCLSSFAYVAERKSYVKPIISDGKSLIIKGGRHPVIESIQSFSYVPNDILLKYEKQRLMIITGPNFSGKSSLLRATALIVIMAQIGCFVPAEEVELGIIDRIFTRIGASDNLVAGQSTFMMEMIDAANLVNNCTDRSLIIADELGRGTSTYDGLAIAWSIAEYLHNLSASPKTMLATHYHQLAELEEILDACVNYHFAIRFEDDKPIFDHRLQRGSSDKSFGVEVAKLSGLPQDVINRARMILDLLETKAARVNPEESSTFSLVELIISEDGQTSLDDWFDESSRKEKPVKPSTVSKLKSSILADIEKIDIEKLTPVDAFNLIISLKERLS